MTNESLMLDDYELLAGTWPDEHGCTVNALADGTHWGNPEPLTSTLLSLMRDGDVVEQTRAGNREPVVNVEIQGPSLAAVAATERELMLRTGRPAALRWQPGDEFAEPCVFDVVWSRLDHVMDDRAESRHIRRFTLKFSALPYARDESLTVTPALAMPPTETETTVLTGASTTGWSAPNEPAWWSVTFASAGGVVSASRTVTDPARIGTFIEAVLNVAAPASLAATPYVTVRHRVAPGTTVDFWVGNTRQQPISTVVDADGWGEATFISSGWTVLAIIVNAYQFDTTSVAYQLEEITASSHPPVRSTPRQLMRTVTVGGSARTEGNIHIDASAGTVQDCMVYTWPQSWPSYSPVLSPYVGGDAVLVTDSTAASGAYQSLADPATWLIPAHTLPHGDYTIVARLKCAALTDGFRRLRVSVKSWVGSLVIGSPVERYVAPWVSGSLEYGLVTLGKFTLPPTRVGPAGAVDITLQRRDDEANDIFVDELYALHEDGSLTMLAQYGGKHVWIEAPSLAEPKGAVWVGESADGSDKWHASWLQRSWQHHVFDPEGVNMLTVVGGCEFADVDLTHYRRHHTHSSPRES